MGVRNESTVNECTDLIPEIVDDLIDDWQQKERFGTYLHLELPTSAEYGKER